MILMSSDTLVGDFVELINAGVLQFLMTYININEVETGNLVGYYVIASAIFAIPLISMTMQFNQKMLLMILLRGFAVSNILAGLVYDYKLIIILRVVGGICAAVMWHMIVAYGMRLVDEIQLSDGVESALLYFGIGSLISVLLAIKCTDKYLRLLTVAIFAWLISSTSVFLLLGGTSGL